MAVNPTLKRIQDVLSVDQLTKHSLIAVEEGRRVERDREFGAGRVGTRIGSSKLTTLEVSHSEIFVAHAESVLTDIFVSEATPRDAQTVLAVMEFGVGKSGATFSRTLAEGLEVFGSGWLSISVQFEDKLAEFLFSPGHSQVNFGVGWVAVRVN